MLLLFQNAAECSEFSDSFWSKADRSGGPDSCWEWRGSRRRGSYGKLKLDGKLLRAPRVALALSAGAPPTSGLWALHSCDNPPCVNPKHLRWGTPLANTVDMDSRGRRVALRGSAHGRTRLSEDDVRTIRRLCASGMSQERVGQTYGITQMAVSKIVTGHNWGWLD